LIGTGAYFAFSDDILPRLIDRQTKMQIPYKDHIAELRAQVDRMSSQFLVKKQVEQQLTALLSAQVDRIGRLEQHISALNDLFTTDKIKSERIAPPLATSAERSTLASTTNDTVNFVAPSDHETHSQSRELPTRATTQQYRIRRAAHQRASLRHRVAAAERITPPGTTPAERSTLASTSNGTVNFVAPSDHETHSHSRELRARATTKQHRIHRTAHQRASLRHRVAAAERIAPPGAFSVEKRPPSNQLTGITMKPDASVADQ